MKLFITLLAVGLLVLGSDAYPRFTTEELDVQFEHFKQTYNRVYANPVEERLRRVIFAEHLDFILRHNDETAQGMHSYTVGVNEFADLSSSEFLARLLNEDGYLVNNQNSSNQLHLNESVQGLPNTVDWVARGMVTKVKNQGAAGSDLSMAAIASVESAHAIKGGPLVNLSDQQVTDCCNVRSGTAVFDRIFQCLIKMGGVDTAASYPDASTSQQCRFNRRGVASNLTTYRDIVSGSEASLQNAIATVGPVSVAIDASQVSFQLYTGGVYDEPACSSMYLNHAVAVVGYGADSAGVQYWKVKNSWGPNWGQNGYILMSRNRGNQCGIASMATYPVVKY